jgi:hypothetical protein
MTQTKLIRLIDEFIEKYGKDFVLWKLCDFYASKLQVEKGETRSIIPVIRGEYTLEDLRKDAKMGAPIEIKLDGAGDRMSNLTYDDLVRDLRKKFKTQGFLYLQYSDSKEEYDKYVEDHKEELKAKKEKMQSDLGEYYRLYHNPFHTIGGRTRK